MKNLEHTVRTERGVAAESHTTIILHVDCSEEYGGRTGGIEVPMIRNKIRVWVKTENSKMSESRSVLKGIGNGSSVKFLRRRPRLQLPRVPD